MLFLQTGWIRLGVREKARKRKRGRERMMEKGEIGKERWGEKQRGIGRG